MFDAHRGHTVTKIEEGAKDLRGRINKAAKEGVLKFEKTESVLLDIRHAKLSLEENAESAIQRSEKYFDELISTLKSRKLKFLDELRTYFSSQVEFIDHSEEQWLQKQEISQKIIKLQTSKDDLKLVEEARLIIEGTPLRYSGLSELSQDIEYKEIHLLENVESDIALGKQHYQFKELLDALRDYLKKGREITNRIRC
jgi:hypothetical protein